MDPELEALRRARMQQMQGGGEQAAQVRFLKVVLFLDSKLKFYKTWLDNRKQAFLCAGQFSKKSDW